MTKYRKSLLSVAAALAISSTALTAGYIPLTNTTDNDNQWVLLGVTGFINDGTAAGVSGQFRITDSVANTITDSAMDYIPVTGMTQVKDLAQVDAISSSPIEVRVDTTGVTYNETEPFRTIYVDSDADGAPDFAFTYKASLEGKVLEYSVAGGDAYELTTGISSVNTFDNPATAIKIAGTVAIPGTSHNELHDLNSMSAFDGDFSDNPPLSTEYDPATHKDAVGGKLTVYSYDAVNQKWDIFDSANTANTNDIDTLLSGKGYWAKIDIGTDGTNVAAAEAGFALGTPAVTTADYTAAGLANGWNLIAFDAVNSEIRNASTGLLITYTAAGGATTITDSSGNHVVTVTIGAGDTDIEIAKNINDTISQAKLTGDIPYTFDLKAIPTTTALQVALISNKKFTVKEVAAAAAMDAATTIAGQIPINTASSLQAGAAVGDVNATGVTSAYGEYAMVIEPLIANDTAKSSQSGAIKITGDTANGIIPLTNVSYTVAGVVADLDAATEADDLHGTLGATTGIDTDMDGTDDHVLLASTAPFTIQDHTFSRVFEYDTTAGTDSVITISANGTESEAAITITQGSTAAQEADDINATSAEANDDGAGNIVIFGKTSGAQDFYVQESIADDLLQPATSNTDMAKGAVKNVYSLNYLAKKQVTNDVTVDVNAIPGDEADTIGFNIVTQLGTITGTVMTPNSTIGTYDKTLGTTADNLALFELYKDQINTDMAAAGLTATATHDYTDPEVVSFDNALITITGEDVISITPVPVDAGAASTETVTVTFTAGTEAGGDTIFTFDGTSQVITGGTAFGLIPADLVGAYGSWTATAPGGGVLLFTYTASTPVADIVAADVTIVDPTAGDTLITYTFDGVITPGRYGDAEAAAVVATDLGNLGTLTGDIATDLKFNSVLSPDYVLSGPLYTMRDNNMTMQALVTGTTDLSDGTVSWDSLDLTRLPSEWLDSQDYNLFDVDAKAGYWAYLQLDTSDNPISITNIELSNNYTHYFNAPVGTDDGVTLNHFSGVLDVEVSGLSDIDSRESTRVTATVNSKRIELTRSSSTSNSYTGKISTNEVQSLQVNTPYEVVIEVADGLGNNFTQTYSTLFDNQKPAAPTVQMIDGELDISHADANVTGFYVFNSVVPEVNTENAKVAYIAEAGTVGVVCESLADVDYSTAAGGLNVIALDGDGTLTTGNASDSKSVAFMPILRDRVLVSDINNAGEILATTGGDEYNTSCASQGALTVNTGVTLTAISSDTTAKLAYRSLGEQEVTAVPITVYLSNGAATPVIIKVTYPDTYADSVSYTAAQRSFFVEIDDVVYGYEPLTEAAIGVGAGSSSATPLSVAALVKTNIQL